MKKCLTIFAVMIFLGAAILNSATITVTRPNTAGTSWEIGSTQTIEWTTSGLSSTDRLKIVLLKGTTKIGTIAESVEIDASPKNWKVGDYIGGTASIGDNYYIKIKHVGATLYDRSDHPFKIRLKYLLADVKIMKKKMKVLTFLPDLTGTVTYTLAPAHPEGYNTSHFQIVVRNSGMGKSNESTNMGAKIVNFGPDGTHQLAGHEAFWEENIPPLNPGETRTFNYTFNFRAPNYYKVVGWVDSWGKVTETGTGEDNSFDTPKFKVPDPE